MTGTVFGLRVEGACAPEHLAPGQPGGSREVVLEAVADLGAAPGDTRRLATTRHADGREHLTVDDWGAAGLRIAAPGHGAHLLSPDGRRVACGPGATGRPQRDELLLAQVLPTAAALQRLEVLHAGAVVLDGLAVAVAAPSGTGKSTLVAALMALGGTFLTDDVLAVEPDGDAVLAHPGPGVLSTSTGAGVEKQRRTVPPGPSARLGWLLFAERGPQGSAFELQVMSEPDPRRLLTATFVSHVGTRERLVAQLDACARIAASVRCARLRVPHGMPPADASKALLRATRSA